LEKTYNLLLKEYKNRTKWRTINYFILVR
jgi:hypothetical protein